MGSKNCRSRRGLWRSLGNSRPLVISRPGLKAPRRAAAGVSQEITAVVVKRAFRAAVQLSRRRPPRHAAATGSGSARPSGRRQGAGRGDDQGQGASRKPPRAASPVRRPHSPTRIGPPATNAWVVCSRLAGRGWSFAKVPARPRRQVAEGGQRGEESQHRQHDQGASLVKKPDALEAIVRSIEEPASPAARHLEDQVVDAVVADEPPLSCRPEPATSVGSPRGPRRSAAHPL